MKQPWLGIDGKVQIDENKIEQDFTGGGVDGDQYRFTVTLTKSNGKLYSVTYRYYKVTGVIFKHEVLQKEVDCSAR